MSVDDLVAGLSTAGIGVYTRAGATEPVSPVTDPGPLRLTRDQVVNLAGETAVGGGYVGAQLDGMVSTQNPALPISYVVAAYVKSGKTAGARFAQHLMGNADWAHAPALVYPNAVLLVFVDDIARDNSPVAVPGSVPRALGSAGTVKLASLSSSGPALAKAVTRSAHQASYVSDAGGQGAPSGICSTLAAWVNGIIDSVFNSLKVDAGGGGVTGLLADLWNMAIDLAQGAAKAALNTLLTPVLGVVKIALAAIGTLSMAASLLHIATVAVNGDPNPVAYGIDPAPPSTGAFHATVSTGGGISWPADMVDCAQQAGVTLPDPNSAKGSTVDWTVKGFPELGVETNHDATVKGDNTATLSYKTNTETNDDATRGPEIDSFLFVTADVTRNDINDLQKLLGTVFTNTLPGPAGAIVSGIVDVLSQPVFDKLKDLLKATGNGSVIVIHHGPAENIPSTTTASSTTTCAAIANGSIPDGTWSGPITFDVAGNPTSAEGTIQSTGSGTLSITVQKGNVTSGSWTADFDSSGSIKVKNGTGKINSMHASLTGGTVTGPAGAPALAGTGTLQGDISVTAGGIGPIDVPISETHGVTATMTVTQTGCGNVTATFIPSFNTQAAGEAAFSGTATWTGTAN